MQIKLIAHLADVHLRTYKHHKEYKEVLTTLIEELTEHFNGYKREETRIILVGDLIHGKTNVSNELLVLGSWFLKSLEEVAPLVVIAGNHDANLTNLDKMDSITPMITFLEGKNITYYKETGCYLDDNIVWCVYSVFDGNVRPDIETARSNYGDEKTYIGLFHAPIIGSITDIGYTIEHGVSLELFDGLDFVACGDIHKRNCYIHKEMKEVENERLDYHLKLGWVLKEDQKTNKLVSKDIQVVYSSSVLQQDFGEKIKSHGYLIWDVDTNTYTEYDVKNPYEFYHFRINSLDDLENNTEKLMNE